jgi:DNA gyrase subunit A
VTIEEEMKRSYLDYAMSVIVSRALPDVRDGLKPVHRRILFAMKEAGYDHTKPHRKSSRIVGDVMGKYHPHGDAAIYDAMVRMAQDFAMRLPLIDGQGNFGSMDGDPPAAMRYTEARLGKVAMTLLDDIDRDTVDFRANYDESTHEPVVLPARFPNLLVNGAGGIAVGMATNIPSHNLGEVVDACIAYIDDPAITVDGLMRHMPGPDFPTGALILGRNGIREAFHTGRGSLTVRARTHIEELRKDREAIIVTEIPYQVNKARMVERIAEVVHEKIVEGISDLRDESNREGVRVVIELKRDAMADVVLNQLFRHTPLQTTFGVNTLALTGGRPMVMNLKDIIAAFVTFREEVIIRRARHDLRQAQDRGHILVGLATAVANIDAVIALIRKSPDAAVAREALMARSWPADEVKALIELIGDPGHVVAADGTYRLSETQAKAILELRLQRLTGLERGKIDAEGAEIAKQIVDLKDFLDRRERRLDAIRTELRAIRHEFATPRRTTLEDMEFEQDVEALIQREDMVVTVTQGGYVKRVPLSAYRSQRRGGRGRTGMATREEDYVTRLFVADTHTPVLFFSTTGMVYKIKVYRLPLGTPQGRGKALVNLFPLDPGETVSAVLPMPEDEASWNAMYVMFATSSGGVRRNSLADFVSVMANGKIAMKLDAGDRLIGVEVCGEAQDVLLAAADGKCVRFSVTDVRVFSGRTSSGVRGMKLESGDAVISMSLLRHVEVSAEERGAYLRLANAKRRAGDEGDESESAAETPEGAAVTLTPERFAELETAEELILTVTVNGFGKRSSAYEYRTTSRGGQGIVNILTSARNGPAVASFTVARGDHILLASDGGRVMRCPVGDIRLAGRSTQGVVVFRCEEGETVVSVTRLEAKTMGDDSGEEEGESGGDIDTGAEAPETGGDA